MTDKINPLSGKVTPGTRKKPKKPQPPKNPIAGKVLPNNPEIKPERPATPLAGIVRSPNRKKLPLVSAAIVIATLGIGTAIYNKLKNNKTNK